MTKPAGLTPEQKAARALRIGASEAAAAIGLSKHETPLHFFKRKRNLLPPEPEEFHHRLGHALEPFVLSEWERDNAVELTRGGEFIDHFLIAHPDARLEGAYVVNAKSSGRASDFGEEDTDQVPISYIVQEHVEMSCCDLRLAYLPVLMFGRKIKRFNVQFDADLWVQLKSRLAQAWADLQAGIEPPATTLDDAKLKWPRSDPGLQREATEEIAYKWRELLNMKALIAEYEAVYAKREFDLKEYMGGASELRWNHQLLATWKSDAKARDVIDMERLKKEQPEIYLEYLKDSIPPRRFLPKEIKQ